MFDYDPPKQKQPVDYTGLKIVVILAPVFFLVAFLSNAEMGLTVSIVLGMIVLAVKMRWKLRRHLWFWAIIVFILVLHVPLFFVVRWPQGNVPTLFYTMPVGIADFVMIMGAISVAEKLFSKNSSPSEEKE